MNNLFNLVNNEINRRQTNIVYKTNWQRLHLDPYLLLGLVALAVIGLIILFSASNGNTMMVFRQALRLCLAFLVMLIVAQIPPRRIRSWSGWIYVFGIVLLIGVLFVGDVGKGARRWLDIGFLRFQPSEILKLATPMVLAAYFSRNPLPPRFHHVIIASAIILIPTFLTIKQPDLGTALVIMVSGGCVLLFAGISWRLIGCITGLGLVSVPILWHYMHDYQRQRVLTFLNPENDPLGNGYHIIQSKIAIGSGGLLGKGWLQGSQSHLHFLPEHDTDFIFAVCGEEFGLVGCTILILVYSYIILRAMYIATQAQDTFSRLIGGSLALVFFLSVVINIGMVTGVLPVVGLPLPLVSYGGTSMVTLMTGFGILMAIHTHRNLWLE